MKINTIEEWLGEHNRLGIDIVKNKYIHNNESFPEFIQRVSGGNERIANVILQKKFLFGGRTLSNRGTDINGSFSNCYSSGYVKDSLTDIMKTMNELALTYKAQGGQGISLTKLRPKGTPVGNGEYTSDGIVPFMELANQTTESISQGGSRKGALIITLDIWHKQAPEFITIKSDTNKIKKANLSLEIDDEFMEIVEKDLKNGTTTVLSVVRTYGKHMVEYEVVPVKLFTLMAEQAWDNGEPAPIYTNKFRNYNLMQFVKGYDIEICNPCGEQPLPKYGACNLGSINLSEFVVNPYTSGAYFDLPEFLKVVDIAVEGLDEVLDEGMKLHALKEQRKMAKDYRNIGLGIMGLSSMFFKLGVVYGSSASKELTEKIIREMFRQAVLTSSHLAIIKGKFPKCNKAIFESDIIKEHFSEAEIKVLKKRGLRNCSLLSIAPSGSIANVFGVTTGCEPAYAIAYSRKTESLHNDEEVSYDIFIQEAKEYMEINNTGILPDYFISAPQINWKDRVELQSILQTSVDTAISSTVNLPNSATVEDVRDLYILAWKLGCKGITVFREGCKRAGILSNGNAPEVKEEVELKWGEVLQTTDNLIGKKRKLTTGCGTLHLTAFFDPINGRLMETYFSKGSSGGCSLFSTGLSRMVSLATRGGVSIDKIVDQLKSSGTCPSYAVRTATKKDTSKGSCCPTAIGFALLEMHKEIMAELSSCSTITPNIVSRETLDVKQVNRAVCPECGEPLIFEGGCNTCKACGWTKCE